MQDSKDNRYDRQIEVWTPESALEVINSPGIQRRLKRGNVIKFAKAMRAGKWDPWFGEPIMFDENGLLINGQHRLHAVVMAGVHVAIMTMRNVPRAKMPYIDSGAKRTRNDAFKLAGIQHYATASSVVPILYMYDNYRVVESRLIRPFKIQNEYHALPDQFFVDQYFKEDEQFNIRESVSNGRKVKYLHPTCASVCYHLFRRIDPARADLFFSSLRVEIVQNTIFKNYRDQYSDHLIAKKSKDPRDRSKILTVGQIYYGLIYTWNRFVNGKIKSKKTALPDTYVEAAHPKNGRSLGI